MIKREKERPFAADMGKSSTEGRKNPSFENWKAKSNVLGGGEGKRTRNPDVCRSAEKSVHPGAVRGRRRGGSRVSCDSKKEEQLRQPRKGLESPRRKG